MKQSQTFPTYAVDAPRSSGRPWLVIATIVATFGLIVLGGIVRITGSGMGCGDEWPLCHGTLVPPARLDVLIEWGHRLSASAVSTLIVAIGVAAWRRRAQEPRSFRLAMLALGTVLVQVLLGMITVKLELHASAVALHLGTAMALFAVLLVLATIRWRPVASTAGPGLRRLIMGAALGIYAVLILGAAVAGTGASWACLDIPLCGGGVVENKMLEHLHMTHRGTAIVVGLLVLAVAVRCWAHPGLRRAAAVALVVTLAQIVVGVVQVLLTLPPEMRALHLAMGTLAWGSMVVLGTLAVSRGEAVAQGRL